MDIRNTYIRITLRLLPDSYKTLKFGNVNLKNIVSNSLIVKVRFLKIVN